MMEIHISGKASIKKPRRETHLGSKDDGYKGRQSVCEQCKGKQSVCEQCRLQGAT